MKKIIMCIMLIMFTIPVLAVGICAKNSIVAVVLDPTVNGSSYQKDDNNFTFKAVFSYGTVSGEVVCLNTNSYSANMETATYGGYCWCRITHPMNSGWYYYWNEGTECAKNCTNRCAYGVVYSDAVRSYLYNSVAAANAAF